MSIVRPIAGPIARSVVSPIGSAALPWEGGGGAAYDPGSELNLIVDLFAESGVTLSSGDATAWVDKKGGVSFTPGGTGPTYSTTGFGGKPCLVGTVAKLGMTTAALSISGGVYTVVAWGSFTDVTTVTQTVWDSETGRSMCSHTLVGVATTGYYDGTANRIAAVAQTGSQCLQWYINGTSVEMKRGATSLGSSACSARVIGARAGVLGNFSASGSGVAVSLGRVLVFNAILSAEAQARIRAWGVSYYGVGA